MSYAALRVLAIVLTIMQGTITLIQLADPVTLGISLLVAHWLAIVAGAIGLTLGFLPRVQEARRRSTDAPPPAESDQSPP